ncbi:MAG: hypothetical protein KGH64_04540 [Candidatus Micrarchaeota archaeon]|nr:hypothetical protein [Candidatus Micrarchaeota archaeon]MDE1834580.1 hypothetical protein [Candidatus Micrarchaeota archaeon]MDE1859649.1 hypothetical protein [Candidatus Micrarchaeota archaeon]
MTTTLLHGSAHIQGEGEDEPKVAMRHVRKIERNGKKVKSFYGDGKFDTNETFTELDKRNIEPKIPVHINASSRGSDPPRRKEVRKQFVANWQKKSWPLFERFRKKTPKISEKVEEECRPWH